MEFRTARFPIPVSWSDIKPGDIFHAIHRDGRSWICLRMELDALILGGSDLVGADFPAFYDVRKLGATYAKTPGEGYALAPSAGLSTDFGVPAPREHGALAIIAEDDAWVVVKPGTMQGEGFANLRTGAWADDLKGEALYYPHWEILVRIGRFNWSMFNRAPKKDPPQ